MNYRDGCYHKTLFFPKELDLLPKDIEVLHYCGYALERARQRRIIIPTSVHNCSIPEIQIEGGKIVKALYRAYHSSHYDICLVMHIINNKPFMVRTVWLNNTTHHITLDKSKYVMA
jgi:hypothetical protein